MIQYTFIGVDVSKARLDVAIKYGDKFKEASFDNSSAGFKLFKKWLNKESANPPFVCLESTGCYSEPLAEYLSQSGIKVSMVNPMQIKHYAKSILSRNKNDQVDARIIAAFAEKFQPSDYRPSTQAEKEIKETARLIEVLEKQKQQFQVQLESIKTVWIRKKIKKSIAEIDKKIDELEILVSQEIEANSETAEIKKHLCGIKGIGDKTAYRLIAYLPDITAFENAKQLAAYCGLSPKQHQSGKYAGKTKLSKYGDARLRKTLYMPALVVKQHNKAFQPFCQRLEKNGLTKKAITGAVMRKLVHIIYGMLKTKLAFNPALV